MRRAKSRTTLWPAKFQRAAYRKPTKAQPLGLALLLGAENIIEQATLRNRSVKVVTRFAAPAAATALLLYGVLAADADGFGFLQYIGAQFGSYKLITRGAYLLLFLLTVSTLLHPLRSELDARVRKIALPPIILSVWIVGACFVKGYDPLGSLSYLVYSGLPAYVIWASFASRGRCTTLLAARGWTRRRGRPGTYRWAEGSRVRLHDRTRAQAVNTYELPTVTPRDSIERPEALFIPSTDRRHEHWHGLR